MSPKIDYKEIIKLIDLLEEKKLSHFELEIEGFKIKISRTQPPASSPEVSTGVSSSPQQIKEENISSSPVSAQKSKNNLYYVTSPMVGTFYRAPDPNSPPFVDVGETVKKDQTLCIIEAMKLMNEIVSDTEGVLKEVHVENGRPVEYGQKLFSIEPLS
ncbi:MAG: acetyl-CoA carboxylase biotin carboxyl carrier protein [Candidatus Aminicenantes bacterium]